MNSASLCSLAGRYDNPITPRFLVPIDAIVALYYCKSVRNKNLCLMSYVCLINVQRGAFAAKETQAVPRHSVASLPSRHIRDGEDSRRQE
jgi:hypothetical protein